MTNGDPLQFFKQNMIYKKTIIHKQFGGQTQGGISTPSEFPMILLFHTSRGVRYGYEDGWSDDGTYLYSGEGAQGDMKYDRGNLAIRDHRKRNRF